MSELTLPDSFPNISYIGVNVYFRGLERYRLLKAVLVVSDSSDDKFIIAMDESFDNDQVAREMKALKRAMSGNNNYVLKLISFEYILLSFTELLDWIYAENDEFRQKRAIEMNARKAVPAAIEADRDYK